MEQKVTYFANPTQVKFYDSENDCWIGGIGYRDELICGCCGGEIDLESFYDEYQDWYNMSTDEEKKRLPENPIKIYPEWVDISQYIVE